MPLEITVLSSLAGVDPAEWDALVGGAPLLRHAFLHALHETGCASADSGWQPTYLVARDAGRLVGAIPLYAKSHSYGEYVFDWSWADAYRRHRRRYYPKLVAAVPFTPASGPRLIAERPAVADALLAQATALAKRLGVSSLHVLFPAEDEARRWQRAGFLLRHGVQFHWRNGGYRDFDDYLGAMTREKRKKIRQERRRVADAGVTMRRLRGAEIGEADWSYFFRCYRDTYAAHGSMPYLDLPFFRRIGRTMPENVLMVVGERAGRRVCAALDVHDSRTLWGRYWGSTESIPGLHFEACYYQAIEFCIAERIEWFEGGAQGTHKIARGFLPVRTWSAHWIADPDFADAIGRFLADERDDVAHTLDELGERSPFRADLQPGSIRGTGPEAGPGNGPPDDDQRDGERDRAIGGASAEG